MRELFIVILASGLCLIGCGQAADGPRALASPAAPTSGITADSQAASAPADRTVEVPFHSDIAWTKVVNGGNPGSCQGLHGDPPAGMAYLMRNTSEGPAVSSHLGAGVFEIHTCVYGRVVDGRPAPAGWLADMHWTAANGDALLATSKFVTWATESGARFAVDKVTFQNGGGGRFQFAEGEAESRVYVSGPLAGHAVYDGTLRYGKKEK